MTDGIHDPAQAWNALTVGGYTEKLTIDAATWPGWQPLAGRGDLAPCSCTSTTWGKWPIKPDIVMEAGNMGRNPAVADPDYPDDLQLLTTAHNFLIQRPLTTFGDTSGAAALAARFAAMVWAKYPALWPETIRALMVHSARMDSRDAGALYRRARCGRLQEFGSLLRVTVSLICVESSQVSITRLRSLSRANSNHFFATRAE